MAANLSGMFQQLNQAVLQNPMAQGGVGQGMLDSAGAHAGNLLGSATGQDPYSFMTPEAKLARGQQDLAKLDLTNSAGKEQAAAIYGKMGQTQQQVAMAQLAQKQQLEEVALQRQQALRESLTKQAAKYDMTDYAEQIASGAVDLDDASKVVQEAERDNILLTRGTAGRKVIAKQYGISEDEFNELGLAEIPEDQFKNFTQGLGAETKPFMRNNVPFIARVNKAGKVWDKDANNGAGMWRNPSDMNLTPAPQVQKVFNQTQDLVKGYGDASVQFYTDLHETANEAVDMLNNVNRAKGLLQNMVVGPGAGIELFARRLAMAYGGDPDQAAANAETYLADSGMRVAKVIKSFGSGSGVSEADREYARQIVAGDIAVTPEAMNELLDIQAKGAQGTIDYFNAADKAARKRLGDEQDILDTFVLKPVTEANPDVLTWVPGKGWQ